MMRFIRSIVLLLLVGSFVLSLNAQSGLSAGIISGSRAVNWTSAGATISTTRTQCGSTVASGTSAATINSDLAACGAGTYLLLGPGTFNMSTGLIIPSNVTLRGSGSNSTFLVFSAGYNCRGESANICVASSDTNYWGGPSNSATWEGTSAVGTYNRGDTQVILSSKSSLAVGNPIILDQVDDQSDTNGLYVGCELGKSNSGGDSSAACYSGAYPTGFSRGGTTLSALRGQQQVVTVTSISGSGPYTVGITPGIYAPNYQTSHSPGAWWASSPKLNVGIESLSIDNTSDGLGGILFFNCQNCWVKGIRSMITSGTVGTGWFHVGWQICNHCTVRDSYFYGTGGDSYAIAAEIGSDDLQENNIVQMPGFVNFYNADCEGCVAGYNFAVNNIYINSSNWLNQASFYHGVDLYTLQEGNIASGLYADSFHGTKAFDTQFRNRYDGQEQNNANATASSTVALRYNPGARYQNAIANVLGTIGYHTVYKAPSSASGSTLYQSVIDTGAYPEGSTQDSLVGSTALFWGNWDSVSKAVRWCGSSSDTGWSTTCSSTSEVPTGAPGYPNSVPTVGDTAAGQAALPASFYYSSTPTWWPSGKAWPIIGPDVTGGNVGQCLGGTQNSNEVISSQSSQCTSAGGSFSALSTVVSNPAMDCYFTKMSGPANGTGSVLAFDSNACYGSGSGSSNTPAAPTNVNGVASPN